MNEYSLAKVQYVNITSVSKYNCIFAKNCLEQEFENRRIETYCILADDYSIR